MCLTSRVCDSGQLKADWNPPLSQIPPASTLPSTFSDTHSENTPAVITHLVMISTLANGSKLKAS